MHWLSPIVLGGGLHVLLCNHTRCMYYGYGSSSTSHCVGVDTHAHAQFQTCNLGLFSSLLKKCVSCQSVSVCPSLGCYCLAADGCLALLLSFKGSCICLVGWFAVAWPWLVVHRRQLYLSGWLVCCGMACLGLEDDFGVCCHWLVQCLFVLYCWSFCSINGLMFGVCLLVATMVWFENLRIMSSHWSGADLLMDHGTACLFCVPGSWFATRWFPM